LARGFTAPTWPVAYGGAGLSSEQARILREESDRLGMPPPLVGMGLAMLGPTLLQFGNEEQKVRHLTGIARGEIRWSQGYSEPNAGSDLASLGAKAVRDGDHFVVSGQKIWTSYASVSDWLFCLVRTNQESSKWTGISFLLIDLETPGIRVRPIELISGQSPFCEVFLDEVRVPVENVVGGIDNGWKVATTLLQHERGMVGASVADGGARPSILNNVTLDQLLDDVGGGDPVLRDEVAKVQIRHQTIRQLVGRINDTVKAGKAPGPMSSVLKVAGTELNKARWDLATRIGGPEWMVWEGNEQNEALTQHWLRTRGNTIEGGTTEIQLNVIAKRVLGLPKGS
jgi:acyl-CoA dehydrogenase